jgi:hypothetical protein
MPGTGRAPNEDVSHEAGVSGCAMPAFEAVNVFLQGRLTWNSGFSLQFAAQGRQFALQSLAQVHKRALQTGSHLLGGGVTHLSAGAVLQHGQERQHRSKPNYQGVPPDVLRGRKPHF